MITLYFYITSTAQASEVINVADFTRKSLQYNDYFIGTQISEYELD